MGKRRNRVRGVAFESGKWRAGLRIDGVDHYAGRWPTEGEARVALDRLLLHHGNETRLTLPGTSRRLGAASADELRREAHVREKSFSKGNYNSRYFGVGWDYAVERWTTTVSDSGRPRYLARFSDERAAAEAYDRVMRYLHRNRDEQPLLKFPGEQLRPTSIDEMRREARARVKRAKKSLYHGVTRKRGGARHPWRAYIDRPGSHGTRLLELGTWATAEEAAIAHDRAMLFYYGRRPQQLNFPRRTLAAADARTLRAKARRKFKAHSRSRFHGVQPFPSGRWYAQITHHEQWHYLGSFDEEEAAARAYDRAALRLQGRNAKLNFHPLTGEELFGQKIPLSKR